jgi:hypothetical protein
MPAQVPIWRPAVLGTGGIQEDRVPGARNRKREIATDKAADENLGGFFVSATQP